MTSKSALSAVTSILVSANFVISASAKVAKSTSSPISTFDIEPYFATNMTFSYEVRFFHFDAEKLELHMWLHLLLHWSTLYRPRNTSPNDSNVISDELPSTVTFTNEDDYPQRFVRKLNKYDIEVTVAGHMVIPCVFRDADRFPFDGADGNISGPSLIVFSDIHCANGSQGRPFLCASPSAEFQSNGIWRISEFQLLWRNHSDLKQLFFHIRLKRRGAFLMSRVLVPGIVHVILAASQLLLSVVHADRVLINAAVLLGLQLFCETISHEPIVSNFGAGARLFNSMSLVLGFNLIFFVWTLGAHVALQCLDDVRPPKQLIALLDRCAWFLDSYSEAEQRGFLHSWMRFVQFIDRILLVLFVAGTLFGVQEILQ